MTPPCSPRPTAWPRSLKEADKARKWRFWQSVADEAGNRCFMWLTHPVPPPPSVSARYRKLAAGELGKLSGALLIRANITGSGWIPVGVAVFEVVMNASN